MNERRLPIGVLAVVPVVIGMAVYAFAGQAQVSDPAADATATAQAEASFAAQATATATPDWWVDSPPQRTPEPDWTPIPQPTPMTSHGPFQDGAWVRVNAGTGDCLNARNQPSLNQEWVIINICVPDGFEGPISGTTQEADGHWWWFLAGLGWVAEDYLSYVREFDARANVVPELSGHPGKVAFLRGNDIWMMKPDGSEQVRLIDNPDSDPNSGTWKPQPRNLAWSPDGSMLSFDVIDYGGQEGGTVSLHVVTVGETRVVAEQVFEDMSGGGWAADSTRIGVIREAKPAEMSDSYEGIPAVLDVTTGGQLVLGSEPFYQDKPPAFNHDGSLLMVNAVEYDDAAGTQTRAIVFYDSEGAEADRIDFLDDAYYASPRWSPTENKIAMHLSEGGVARYAVYDLATRGVTGEAQPPKISDRIGGRCGGGDMWRTAWSADGRRVMYTFGLGDSGANGVWSWDIATGEQRIIPAAGVGAATSGPGSLVMFSSSWNESFIFAGANDGGLAQVVTDGSSPVWFIGE